MIKSSYRQLFIPGAIAFICWYLLSFVQNQYIMAKVLYGFLYTSNGNSIVSWSALVVEQLFSDPILLNNTRSYQNISCNQLEECNTWIQWMRFNAAKLCEKQLLNEPDITPGTVTEYTEKDPHKDYSNPFVIRGAALDLSRTWGYDPNDPNKKYDYLKTRFGNYDVLVARNQTNDSVHGSSDDFYYTKFEKYIDMVQKNTSSMDSVIIEDGFREAYTSDLLPYVHKIKNMTLTTSHLFIGNRNVSSSWHYAMNRNVFIQVYGVKHWCFIKQYNWVYMRAYFHPILYGRSFVNLNILRKIPKTCVTLYPGDMLFNPAFVWHTVQNKDTFNLGIANRLYDSICIGERSKTGDSIRIFLMEDSKDKETYIDEY